MTSTPDGVAGQDPGAEAQSAEAWARAVESRDSRFDGWITVGVASTGIYCRPSCPTPVRPLRKNMRFFPTAASAQAAGFRACKRCAPDATPGSPEWNRRDDLVGRAIRAIDDGLVDRAGVQGLADHLAVSSRHLHRLLVSEVGATPLGLARARRARAARILIETTTIPFADVAFAAGFDSIRQFNDTVREVFASSPTTLRERATQRPIPTTSAGDTDGAPEGWISLRMPHREPYDVEQVLWWLASHTVGGVEQTATDTGLFRRSLCLPGGPGVAEISFGADPDTGEVQIEARFLLTQLSDLQTAIQRTRRLLDLDADPTVINDALSNDERMQPLVSRRPGIRSPGGIDGTDVAIRTIVHQQVSVAAACGTLGRLVAAYGEPLPIPVGEVTHVFPTAEALAAIDPDDLAMPKTKANSLVTVAAALADGSLDLSPAADRASAVKQLESFKGIGPWTSSIVSLRALADPDVLVPGDLALVRVAEHLGIGSRRDDLEAAAERWRPWRSYATHHLWVTYPELKLTPAKNNRRTARG